MGPAEGASSLRRTPGERASRGRTCSIEGCLIYQVMAVTASAEDNHRAAMADQRRRR